MAGDRIPLPGLGLQMGIYDLAGVIRPKPQAVFLHLFCFVLPDEPIEVHEVPIIGNITHSSCHVTTGMAIPTMKRVVPED